MKKIISLVFLLTILFSSRAQFTNQFYTYSTVNTPVFTGNNFKAVWVGKGNTIWAGTQYQGLYRFDTTRKAWTKSGQLTNVFINQIQIDKDSGIWIAQSGTSGSSGGGSNTAGGVNYFPDTTDAGMQYFNTNYFLNSRNVRGLYLDTLNTIGPGYRRIWVPQATFTTSGNIAPGGITKWQETGTGNFQITNGGLQLYNNTNAVSSGTPSCYTACGNKSEVWVGVETNYTLSTGSTSQILRYDATTGNFLGGYDQNGTFDNTRMNYLDQARVYTDTSSGSSRGVLPANFRTTAMYVDAEDRHWIGLRNGGLVVKIGSNWKSVNMPTIFPPGTVINFNAITSDEFGYVYIGTSNGLVVFDNGGDITDTSFYKRFTTTDSLPSNNITGVAYDKAGGRMVLTSDAGVTFYKVAYRINVRMQWDYSFPNRPNQPIGVAADGVSRIYLRIKKGNDTLPNIKALTVSLKRYNAATANTRGKLKKATIINKYSEEATIGTSSEVTITDADLMPNGPGEFWVWYVSPEDFCSDTTSAFANLRRRYDTVTVIATYTTNVKDTMDYKIGVVRPPTIFVHGLASSPEAWDFLRHNNNGQYVPFVNSPLLTYKNAPKMDPVAYFNKNALQLLGGDVNAYANNEDRLNTLQGNLEAIRNMRYAANQVDYVCHSMGGIMIRTAIGVFGRKFFAGEGDPYIYKTYKKGFTHKIITINTPHNGAPVADLLDQFVPLAPARFRFIMNEAYVYKTALIGGFIKPQGEAFINLLAPFEATDAVHNLQVTDARGGQNMLKTPAKYHMIIGDLNWTNYNESLGLKWDFGLSILYRALLQTMYASTYDAGVFNPSTAASARSFIENIMGKPAKEMIAAFLNYVADKRGYHNYMADSDGVVPVGSQTARQITLLNHISRFFCTDTAGGSQGLNANHSAMLQRDDVGQRVFQLLNTRLSSVVFADEIPADNDGDSTVLLRPAPQLGERPVAAPVIQTLYDTTKIKIDAPSANGVVMVDDLISIKFRVKDTARLAYQSVYFQLLDSFRTVKTRLQQTIQFRVNPSFIGVNKIWAMAAYRNAAGTGMDYYLDSVMVMANSAMPLQGFRLQPDVVNITVGEPYFPAYEVKYNNQWVTLPNNAPGIGIAIDSATIMQYGATTGQFNGLKTGATVANFSYNGFTDSILFKVIMPYNSNCINRTIASGSFKNPAIWSKGTVPDVCDSVIISAGHTVSVDSNVIIRSLRISSGGTLNVNVAADTLRLGQGDDAFALADNYGTLNISNGGFYVNGRIRFFAASTFNMSNGKLTIDANRGLKESSVTSGAMLEAATGMTAFNFSGGTFQVNDPPYESTGQTLNCPYDFGNASTLVLGINTSTIASKNNDGFGGLQFPNKIGKLIINAGTRNGNRQFVNKKTLLIKGGVEVKTGSEIILQAPMNVTP